MDDKPNPEADKVTGPPGPPPPVAGAALDEPPAIEVAPEPTKPKSAYPRQVPLETGLSDYSMWTQIFTDADIPPLPKGARRGRIWT